MEKWTRVQLIEYCKEKGITKYSRKKKEEILYMIDPTRYDINISAYEMPSPENKNIEILKPIKTKIKFMAVFQRVYEDIIFTELSNWLKKGGNDKKLSTELIHIYNEICTANNRTKERSLKVKSYERSILEVESPLSFWLTHTEICKINVKLIDCSNLWSEDPLKNFWIKKSLDTMYQKYEVHIDVKDVIIAIKINFIPEGTLNRKETSIKDKRLRNLLFKHYIKGLIDQGSSAEELDIICKLVQR